MFSIQIEKFRKPIFFPSVEIETKLKIFSEIKPTSIKDKVS